MFQPPLAPTQVAERLASTQHITHTVGDGSRIKWLEDKVRCANIVGMTDGFIFAAAGDNNDGNIPAFGLSAKLAANCQSILSRHTHIKQDKVGKRSRHGGDCAFPVFRLDNVNVKTTQTMTNQRANLTVVING